MRWVLLVWRATQEPSASLQLPLPFAVPRPASGLALQGLSAPAAGTGRPKKAPGTRRPSSSVKPQHGAQGPGTFRGLGQTARAGSQASGAGWRPFVRKGSCRRVSRSNAESGRRSRGSGSRCPEVGQRLHFRKQRNWAASA